MIYRMKLWQKIFIVSLVTNIFLFAICGIFVMVSGHKLNLDYEQSFLIPGEEQLDVAMEKIVSLEKLEDLMQGLSAINVGNDLSLRVYIKDALIVDTLNVEMERPRYDLSAAQNRGNLYVEEIQDTHYYFSVREYESNQGVIRINLIRNIESVYQRANQQLTILFYLCLILSMIAAFIMLTTSLLFTLPIKKINEAVTYITSNNYSFRLPVYNMDELNELSEKINVMSNAVERNIVNYKSAINNFTHDVKTPLTSIMGYSEIISNDNFSNEIKAEAAEYIRKESKRLNSLVDKIISFLTVGVDGMEYSKIDVSDLIEASCLTVKMQAEMKDMKIQVPDCEGIFLYGDSELMTVLLVNLLDNAIKASNDGGTINILLQHESKQLSRLKVVDYGIGIPAEDIENLTEVFYMVDKSRSRSQKGLGLGLAICSEIVKSHGASLRFESELNKGTTVTIQFLDHRSKMGLLDGRLG